MHLAARRTLIACALADDAAASAAARALLDLGVAGSSLRFGAGDPARAVSLAAPVGAAADLDPRDPLAGAAGLARESDASSRTDRGALVGALAGIIAGVGVASSPLHGLVSAPAPFEPLADALVFGVIGLACGAVLGAALGQQRSTHAGFRLVDAGEAGDVILTALVPLDAAGAAADALERAGAHDIALFEGQP